MKAMILAEPRYPLRLLERTIPVPGPSEVLVQVSACAVCRTDLHVFDGDLPNPKLPLILGHEIVGKVIQLGTNVHTVRNGERVGVPWLGWTCGKCFYCTTGRENLCDFASFTGYNRDGGYAEYTVADERSCIGIPERYCDIDAAPLLCAGLIGYRSLKMTEESQRIGIYGFGAAAHLVCQIAQYQGREIYAFTRSGDVDGQRFASSLGAVWAGSSDEDPPKELDAAIIFAPVGQLVLAALKSVRKGGIVVCGGIHMSDIPSFPYRYIWGERTLRSVANLTRQDGVEFMTLAQKIPIEPTVQSFPLSQANQALQCLRTGQLRGSAVLVNEQIS